MLAIALSLLFAGCDILTKLGIGSGDDSDEGGEPAWTGPQIVAEDETGIKAKFGIEAEGTEGVTAAFETLHAFIQSGGLAKYPDAIRLGDWIDLEGGLAVEAYGTGEDNYTGGFSHDAEKAVEAVYNEYNEGNPWGTLLRLIVVGINSFQSGKGRDGKYEITDNDGTPHVVFQFQNVPVTRRMNPANDNTGGYEKSEMRKYLVPVADDGESGNFLAGLYHAGVPEGVLWAPARVLGTNGTGSVTLLNDSLWLPTESEMYAHAMASGETKENQARLEYYTDNISRVKALSGSSTKWYWTGSAYSVGSTSFCCFIYTLSSSKASNAGGVAPAFCVN